MVIWECSGGVLLVVFYLLLVFVLILGVGKFVNGSICWINFGFINI